MKGVTRRAGDGDPPGDDPLLYDHPRGGAAGHPGRCTGPNATSHERIFITRPEEFNVARLERFLWRVSQPGWRADMAWVEELLRLVLGLPGREGTGTGAGGLGCVLCTTI
jgi:hypothetical protein